MFLRLEHCLVRSLPIVFGKTVKSIVGYDIILPLHFEGIKDHWIGV